METDFISRWRAQDAMTEENLIRNLDQVENGDAKRYARAAIRVLEQLEPADVRPVVRGHWIGKDEAEKIFEENYSDYPYGNCSVCGHCDWDCVEAEGFNYCPNCGAEMTGGSGNV